MKTAALILAAALTAGAQLPAPNDAGIAMGHLHLNVRDVEAHTKFWTDHLGGTTAKFGRTDVMKFPGVLIFLTKRDPSGGTEGSVINHIGFLVPDLDKNLKKWKETGVQIAQENLATRQVFLIAPESPVFSISTANQPSLGNTNAPVTIIAFTDYQCPSCASMHPNLERVGKEYGDKVRLVARDFPLTQHADAFKAAEAAEAAREQGKYWEYVQVLLRNQSLLTVEKLKGYATEVGLDRARFDSALDSGKFRELVQLDIDDGIRLGLKGTPTLFLNGRRVSVKSYEELKALIDAALKTTKTVAADFRR